MGGVVLRLEGASLVTVWSKDYPEPQWGTLTLVADVDLDAQPEIVIGNRIFDGVTGLDETPLVIGAIAAGYPAVAQFDPSTPHPELVLVSSSGTAAARLGIFEIKTGAAFFGPYDVAYGGVLAGAPVVADFDGDKMPEVGVASKTDYRVYDPECAGSPLPAKCAGPGILWKSEIRDNSSAATSSSVFDFNGDCEPEVVHRDECWLRIYQGKTGDVLAAFAITSGTGLDEPVIADVDGDNHAEIVVSSNLRVVGSGEYECPGTPEDHVGAPWTGPTYGVFVLRDPGPDERWAPARRVWNQHTYHITNVNDDGTIPIPEPRSWDGPNSYRQNVRP